MDIFLFLIPVLLGVFIPIYLVKFFDKRNVNKIKLKKQQDDLNKRNLLFNEANELKIDIEADEDLALLEKKIKLEKVKREAKANSINWAKNVFENKNKYVILDTETTGLGKTDVIIELALIDLDGTILFNSRIQPTKKKRISKESTAIHGITIKDLQGMPYFSEVVEEIYNLLKDKTVLIYNAEFDERMIDQTTEIDELRYLHFKSECIMKKYAAFKNNWSEYWNDFSFPKLPSADHSALGDCKAALNVLHKMVKNPN